MRPPPRRRARPARARIVSYRNTEVVVEADSPGGGWVVLNDLWHPWWFAEVDGQPAEILRANVLFRAVAVPPGRHMCALHLPAPRRRLGALTGRAHAIRGMPCSPFMLPSAPP